MREPIDLGWNRLKAHDSPAVREVLRRQPRARMHPLPSYATELNPVEPIWANAKAGELRGFAGDDESTCI